MKPVRIADWIVRNLQEFGNCSLPEKLVQLYGFKAIEKELSRVLQQPVYIRVAGIDVMSENRKKNRQLAEDIYYIAETEVKIRKTRNFH